MRKPLIFGSILLATTTIAGLWFEIPALGWVDDKPFTMYGNIDIRQVPLGFRVTGRIEKVFFEEGDDVKAGSVIARLDNVPYKNAVDAVEAEVLGLRSTLDKLVAGPRKSEIAQAAATLNERLADLEHMELVLERAVRLRPNGTISQAGLDEASAQHAAAVARAESAREALGLLQEGSRAEDIATARANLAAAEAKLASARTSLADTELRAPNDGIILSRVREEGAIVSSSDIVSVLTLRQPVWVRSYIPETDLGKIHPGMQLDVYSDTHPDAPVKGTVGFISPVAEFTPKSVETAELRTDLVYRLRIIIADAGPQLRQGMPVTIKLPQAGGETK
ncbi:MAG: secretion protein HlyD [Phyllobacterium sp.]|uniref:secretion protein HlyD n=1 Tax=Phyllobacterium sp. TaxID=1871046 RepID=UPI0030F2C532